MAVLWMHGWSSGARLVTSICGDAGNRHIYVRLRDIDAASLATRMQRTLSLRSPEAAAASRERPGGQHGQAAPRSALTALLTDDSSRYGCLITSVPAFLLRKNLSASRQTLTWAWPCVCPTVASASCGVLNFPANVSQRC